MKEFSFFACHIVIYDYICPCKTLTPAAMVNSGKRIMTTLEKKIDENFTTKKGTIKVNCASALYLIQHPNETIRPVHTSGSGRWTSYSDLSNHTTIALKSVGIDFVVGNDAPRGGMTGKFIRLTTKGKKQVAAYNRERVQKAELIKAESEAEFFRQKEQRKADVQAALEGIDANEVLKEFFKSEFHPAPARVMYAKISTGLSWGELRESFK